MPGRERKLTLAVTQGSGRTADRAVRRNAETIEIGANVVASSCDGPGSLSLA